MDRGAWQATVPGGAKESDRTEHLSTLAFLEAETLSGETLPLHREGRLNPSRKGPSRKISLGA